jgi:hypothetical protein
MSISVEQREAADLATGSQSRGTGVADLSPDILRPLLEGARARGMADAFELLGIPVVLIGAAGEVLHVGTGAEARMGGSAAVASRHLVGADAGSNRALQELVAAALAGKEKSVKLKPRGGRKAVSARSLPLPASWNNAHQLAKAIIVFDKAPKPIDEAASGD